MADQETYESIRNEISNETDPMKLFNIYRGLANKDKHLGRGQKASLKKEIVAKISLLSANHAVWEKMMRWMSYRPSDDFKMLVASKIVETAHEFEHWRRMIRRCACFGQYGDLIAEKLIEHASNISELIIAYNFSQVGSEYQIRAIDKILSLVDNFNIWFKLYCRSPKESLLREKLVDHLEFLKPSLAEMWRAYGSAVCRKHQAGMFILTKIAEMSTSLDDWCRLYAESPESCPLKELAASKIKELL